MAEENLLTIGGLLNKRMFAPHKKKEDTFRRIGKVRRFVFHPTEKRVVGIIVKRPDVALMFHRHDLFVAIDRIRVVENGLVMDDAPDSTDQKACKRLGIEWEKCLLWLGMEIVTESGQTLGRVGDVTFVEGTGRVVSMRRDEGATARMLLGVENIPAELVRGFRFGMGSQMADYEDEVKAGEDGLSGDDDSDDAPAEDVENFGAILVADEVVDLDPEGGIAEKAGAATARMAHKGKQAFEKAKVQGAEAAEKAKDVAREKAAPKMEELGEKAGEAINKGAYATGRQIGRAKGMFAGFMDEYRKAVSGDADDEDDES